jgi:oligopeptide transport system substrate-binding protein
MKTLAFPKFLIIKSLIIKPLIILLVLSLAACTTPGPVPATDVLPQETAPLVSTNTPSPTAAPPTATQPPTPTAPPTVTPTLPPTPTPKGFFSSAAGFSFVLPSDWTMVSDSTSTVMFENARDRMNFFAYASPLEDEAGSLQEFIDELVLDFRSDYPDFKERTRETAQIGSEISAEKVNASGKHSSGFELGVIIYYAQKNNKEYVMLFIGASQTLDMRSVAMEKIMETVALGAQPIYGIDPSKALIMRSGNPEPDDLDPAINSGSAAGFVGHMFSGLVRLSPQLQVIPDLADSWTISPDGTVYTFTLRTNLTFHAGNPITAADVKYSWERAADPDTRSTTARAYLGDIVGLKEKLDGKAEEISGVQVVDERTLVVTVDGPKPYFLAKLSYPTAYVVDKGDIDADPEKWMFSPNASGPFFIQKLEEEKVLIFQRNEAYYQPAGLEYIIYLMDRYGSPLSFFKAGEVDITYVANEDALLIMDDPAHALYENLHSTTNMCTTFLKFNNQKAPMDDPLVRKAFALAVDRDKMIEELYDDINIKAETILPPAMPGFSAEHTFSDFDPAAAKEALQASSYSTSMPTVILQAMGYGNEASPFLDALVDMWRRHLGISIKVEFIDQTNFTEVARKNPQHIVSYGWCADYPDPENFIDLLFHSDSDFNVSGYSNPEVDALLEQARTELDASQRVALYRQAEQLLLDDYSTLPIVHTVSFTLVSSRVQGYVDPPMGAPIMHLLRLEQPR